MQLMLRSPPVLLIMEVIVWWLHKYRSINESYIRSDRINLIKSLFLTVEAADGGTVFLQGPFWSCSGAFGFITWCFSASYFWCFRFLSPLVHIGLKVEIGRSSPSLHQMLNSRRNFHYQLLSEHGPQHSKHAYTWLFYVKLYTVLYYSISIHNCMCRSGDCMASPGPETLTQL